MNGTSDTNDVTPGANGSDFGPEQAAELLGQTQRKAGREFSPNPPAYVITMAFVALIAFGALWLSVLGQHPYQGPRAWAIGVVFTIVVLIIILALASTNRANAGVARKRSRQIRLAGSVAAAAWILAYVYEGALNRSGVSNAILNGIYPATAPLMIVSLVAAAISAMREEWPFFGGALGVACSAAVAAYTGPIAAWLVMGIGVFLSLVGATIFRALRQRA